MRRRRVLMALLPVVVAQTLGSCGEDDRFCKGRTSDPLRALFIGFLCSGAPLDNEVPIPSFTITPTKVESGATVTFDASGSVDPDGSIERYEWSLDGVGTGASETFEVDGGTQPKLEQQIFATTHEDRRIVLRVTDDDGAKAERAGLLTITPPADPLTAAFTVTPSPAFVGQPVFFDASGSTGAVSYSWDFGDAGPFTAPDPSSTASHVYTSPGERVVVLVVSDAGGRIAPAQRTLNVRASASAGADAAAIARAAIRAHRRRPAASARGRRFTGRLTEVTLPLDPNAITRRGSIGSLRGVRATGRLVARGRRLGVLRRFRHARWIARLNLSANLRTLSVTMRGLALATLTRGRGQGCLRIAITARAGRRPTGVLKILGGNGAASRLAGRAKFRYRLGDDAVRLRGRIRIRTRVPSPLPAACSRLH